MREYPDYACKCCGYTNGDMFYDRDGEITDRDVVEFETYRKMWRLFKDREEAREEEIKAHVFPRSNIGHRVSQETRDKISATIRAKKATN